MNIYFCDFLSCFWMTSSCPRKRSLPIKRRQAFSTLGNGMEFWLISRGPNLQATLNCSGWQKPRQTVKGPHWLLSAGRAKDTKEVMRTHKPWLSTPLRHRFSGSGPPSLSLEGGGGERSSSGSPDHHDPPLHTHPFPLPASLSNPCCSSSRSAGGGHTESPANLLPEARASAGLVHGLALPGMFLAGLSWCS